MDRKNTNLWAILLTVLMTIMEMSALPAALFCNVKVEDIDPIYITLMVNFLIAFAVCFICRRITFS